MGEYVNKEIWINSDSYEAVKIAAKHYLKTANEPNRSDASKAYYMRQAVRLSSLIMAYQHGRVVDDAEVMRKFYD